MEEKSHKIKVLNIGGGYALDCDGFQQLAIDIRELNEKVGTDIIKTYGGRNYAKLIFNLNYGFEIEYTIKPITRSPF